MLCSSHEQLLAAIPGTLAHLCSPRLPPSLPLRSITPTFAACAVFVDNARWDGVPFLLKAGKALASRVAEIRVQFRHVPGNLYRNKLGLDLDRATNELVRCVRTVSAACIRHPALVTFPPSYPSPSPPHPTPTPLTTPPPLPPPCQVIRIQPNEGIYMKINNKVPGLGLRIDTTRLDLTYKAKYDALLPGG